MSWWYRWTSPLDAAPGATFTQRDLVRRGRIASAIMLFLALILIAVAAIGWFGPNKQIFYTALIVWVAIGIGVVLNIASSQSGWAPALPLDQYGDVSQRRMNSSSNFTRFIVLGRVRNCGCGALSDISLICDW